MQTAYPCIGHVPNHCFHKCLGHLTSIPRIGMARIENPLEMILHAYKYPEHILFNDENHQNMLTFTIKIARSQTWLSTNPPSCGISTIKDESTIFTIRIFPYRIVWCSWSSFIRKNIQSSIKTWSVPSDKYLSTELWMCQKMCIYNMAVRVVEFPNGGYKIRKIFA